MTLFLVLPPQHWLLEGFTSGLVALANYVTQNVSAVTVKFLDLSHVPVDKLLPAIQSHAATESGTLVAGITTTTATYQSALAVAAAFKTVDRRIPVILGGHHSNAEDELILKRHRDIDFVLRGEGERALALFLQQYPDVHSVPGLSFRDGDSVIRNPEGPRLTPQELDALSIEFADMDLRGPLGRCDHVTYVSARGCPLKCAFCAVANERVRAKSIEQVVSDIDMLTGTYHFQRIGIEDNFFAQSQARTMALCRALTDFRRSRPWVDFSWDCQTRVESMTHPELVHLLAAAGCEGVFLGVENFDTRALLYLNKTRRPESYTELFLDRVLPLILETRMACYVNFQVGIPFEDQQVRERNLAILGAAGALAKRRGGKLVLCPMLHVVYPGTPLFHGLVSEGTLSHDIFEEFTRWEADVEPIKRWLGRHFAHGTGGIPLGTLVRPLRSGEEFEVDPKRVFDIENYLADIRAIDGLEVFEYEPYLVPGDL